MITINDCLNFKHKYEITPAEGQCPGNALPRELSNRILSYLWVGLHTNEVCKRWNEYFIEVLKQDFVVLNILARILKLPVSTFSLAVKKRQLIFNLRDIETENLEFYEWYFEHIVQSSFFENVFSVARNRRSDFSMMIRLNAVDEVLTDEMIRRISKEDAEGLCIRLVFRGDVEKALKFAKSWKNQDLLSEIAKALPSIGHYSKSLEIAKELEPKEKGSVYGLNAFWLLQLGEEEKGMMLANMTPEDSSCAKAYAFGTMAYCFLGWGNLDKACEMMEKMEALYDGSSEVQGMCDAIIMEISKAFHRKEYTEKAIVIAERIHNDGIKGYFIGELKTGNEPLSCILM